MCEKDSSFENATSMSSLEHSGLVVECLTRDRGFEPHRRRCVVSLSKTYLYLLSTGSTQEDPSQHH